DGSGAPPAAPRVQQPSVSEIILHILRSGERQGLAGMEPADVYDALVTRGWNVNKDTLRARMWKMEQAGKLRKIGDSSRYALPGDEKPADKASEGEQSAGLSQPARDGEPVQEVEHDN